MAWARVCASCCQQLAEAVLPMSRVDGTEERTPLLSSAPASLPPTPSIQRGPGTPNAGFLCSPNGFTSSDPFSEECGEVGLSASSSSFQGPEASGASWPSVVLLPDLEQNERQGECALPGAAPAGLAPLKPEASWSSSPEPTSCITTRIEAETGTRDRGSIGPGPDQGSWLPYCHGSPETSEPRRVQLLTVPGGLWGCVDPVTNQRNHLSQVLWWRGFQVPVEERKPLGNILLNLTIPGSRSLDLGKKAGFTLPSPLTPLSFTANVWNTGCLLQSRFNCLLCTFSDENWVSCIE